MNTELIAKLLDAYETDYVGAAEMEYGTGDEARERFNKKLIVIRARAYLRNVTTGLPLFADGEEKE